MPPKGTCRLALFLLMLATAASAGPWPREPKALFLSLSVEADRNDNSYVGLYGEYGLSPRRTLGFELGHASIGETSAMIWLQQARGDGSGANRWVTSLGLGGFERDGDLVPVVQIGAAWGRGIDWLPGGGWITVESRVKVAGKQQEIEPEPEENVVYEGDALTYLTPQVTTKLEATLGFRPFTGMMLINQLRLEDRDDTGLSGKLASSVVRDLAGPAKIELGLVLPLAGDGEAAVKLGSWLEF